MVRQKRQSGYTMITVMIALAVAAIAGAYELKKQTRIIDQDRAKATGLKIAQINNAIRKRIADEGKTTIPGVYLGVDWLHSTANCAGGLASKEYLPCNIDGNFFFNLQAVSTITNSAGAVAGSTNFGTIKTDTKARLDLANLAVLAANNENLHGDTPIAGTFYSYTIDAAGNIIASTTYSADLDQWLRTDGTNTMKATLNMGGNQIKNLAAATAGSACSGPGIAQENGALLGCVNNKWTKQGSDYWRDPVSTFAALPTTDPVGAVRETLDTGRIFTWNGGSWIAIAVDQNGNMTVPVGLWTQYMVDTNNPGYYVNPDGNNRLNSVDADFVHTYATIGADSTITPGWQAETGGCSPNGAQGRAAYTVASGWAYDGSPLACVNGVWKKVGGGGINMAGAYWAGAGSGSWQTCPQNYVVVGTHSSDYGWTVMLDAVQCAPLN